MREPPPRPPPPDAVQTHMTNSRLTDPEVLEWRFPVLLVSFGLRRGSGGAGRWRGGDGVVRQVKVLERCVHLYSCDVCACVCVRGR